MKNLVFFILPLALLTAVLGILAGLFRIGWNGPLAVSHLAMYHGIFMTGGFLGTLISLERVVVFKKKIAWAAPLLMGLSPPTFLLGEPSAALILLLTGALGYLLISISIHLNHNHKGNLFLVIGALFQLLALGVFYWLYSYPMAMAAWFLSFLFTIIGERLHLSSFLPVSRRQFWILYIAAGVAVVGTALYHFFSALPAALGFAAVALWLLKNDLIKVVYPKRGFYKYLGVSLTAGYVWLLLFALLSALPSKSPWHYDAVVHSFFAGFILNMILAHGPIIFPAILGVQGKPFHNAMYVALVLLNLSNLCRIMADMYQIPVVRKWSGLFSGLAFLGFVFVMAVLMLRLRFNFRVQKNLVS